MKKLSLLFVAALCVSGVALHAAEPAPTRAADKSTTKTLKKDKATSGTKKTAKLKELGNTLCPIGKHPVGSMQKGSHLVYKGYKVGLCCDGCAKKFNTDPEAYFKIAQQSVK